MEGRISHTAWVEGSLYTKEPLEGLVQYIYEMFRWILFICPFIPAPLPSSICFVPQETNQHGPCQWDPLFSSCILQFQIKILESGRRVRWVFISQKVAKFWLLPFSKDPRPILAGSSYSLSPQVIRVFPLCALRSRDSHRSLLLLGLRCCALPCFPSPAITFIVGLIIKLISITHFEYAICFLPGLWLVHVGNIISWLLWECGAHRG